MPRTAIPLKDPLAPFSISTHTYKIVDGHEILADVLIPKKLLLLGPGSDEWTKGRPILVRVHGGGLVSEGFCFSFFACFVCRLTSFIFLEVTGLRTDESYVPRWLYSFAHEHDAIIVSPDYRLLPEATAEELLDDLDDFWAWLSSDLPSVARDVSAKAAGAATATGLEVDLGRVIVHGESAGGYCAIQMVLSNFKPQTEDSASQTPRIRALIPKMCDFRHRHWTEAYTKDINGAPQLPASTIDDHLASIKSATSRPIVSSAEYTDARGLLFLAAVQQGRMHELLGPEREGRRRVHIEDRLADGAKLPPTLLVHGTADTGVVVECADRLAALVRELDAVVRPEGLEDWESLMYARVEGEEHGFDLDFGPEDAEWVRKGLDFIERVWLGVD